MATPLIAKLLALSVLSVVWLLISVRSLRLDPNQVYHLAALQRDQRKARFYFLSVWAGLGSAFLSLLCAEALTHVNFEATVTRNWTQGIVNGVGLWGIMIIAMVWMQVGQRVNQSNSDGQSLTQLPEKEKNRKPDSRRDR